jgi:DNA-directed RNA polymerase subunit RPC12/RpoP
MAMQGKCIKCKIGKRLNQDISLKNLYCKKCGGKIYATTHNLRWTWEEVDRVKVRYDKVFI